MTALPSPKRPPRGSRPAICAALLLASCASSRATAALAFASLEPSPPAANDVFKQDAPGAVSEGDLARLLAAPAAVEPGTRVGVVAVSAGFEPDAELQRAPMPGALAEALERSGLFQASSEVASEWPIDRGTAGLRELAARYRTSYLALYRQRFVEDTWTNAWGWLIPTVIGGLVAPNQTLHTEGTLEVTLFDVRTGTLLFTVVQRVSGEAHESVWNDDRKIRQLESRLTEAAADALAEQVISKVRRLIPPAAGEASPSVSDSVRPFHSPSAGQAALASPGSADASRVGSSCARRPSA